MLLYLIALVLEHSWAASQGRTDAVALLMKAGADPQRPPSTGTFAGKNALMWAASQGRANVLHFLVAAGVAVDYSSSSGKFKVLYFQLLWLNIQSFLRRVKPLSCGLLVKGGMIVSRHF